MKLAKARFMATALSFSTLFMLNLGANLAYGATSTNPKETLTHMFNQAPWYQGTVEDALSTAAKSQKPILLYWGAVWCPPCNQLKATVFNQARFKELMANAVPVYLDGDTEMAQTWAEKLSVASYPTVLLLSQPTDLKSSPKELLRVEGSLSVTEFAEAIEDSLVTGMSLDSAIATIEAGKADLQSWKIVAGTSWGLLDSKKYPAEMRLSILKSLDSKFSAAGLDPVVAASLRSRLSAALLSDALSAESEADPKTKELLAGIREIAPQLVANIFKTPQTAYSSRSFVVSSGVATIKFMFPPPSNKVQQGAQQKLISLWTKNAEELRKNSDLFVDTWLWSFMPEFEFWEHLNPDKPAPAALANKIRKAVHTADKRAVSEYERLAMIYGAADILKQIGQVEEAKKMLTDELKVSHTPWYYLSSLAGVAYFEKKYPDALDYAKRARLEARIQKNATRVQWIVSDLVMSGKVEPVDPKRMVEVIDDYYETALSLKDGFYGRNLTRAKAVAKEIKKHAGMKELQDRVSHFAKICLAAENQSCKTHFDSLATPAS